MPKFLRRLLSNSYQRFDLGTEKFRHRLAFKDAVPQLTLLGLISGIVAGLLIVLFRYAITSPIQFFNGNDAVDFESLSPMWRFALPFAGAVVIGAVLSRIKPAHRQVSVSHVLDRLHNHQGQLPGKNVAVQFFGGVAALLTGQSAGREGPAIHLGAGVASLFGQYLKLPNNSLRVLVGCGVAAGIAASFNTPIAGVIFAMEVVLLEYTIAGFIPVIVAAVVGTAISKMVFGDNPLLSLTPITMNSLWELPFLLLAGGVIATIAAAYTRLHLVLTKRIKLPYFYRFIVIGLVTGLLAIPAPQILGVGYDTISAAALGQIALQTLLLIIVAKILATSVATALGLPGGLIGPLLIIGACIGGTIGIAGNFINPALASNAGFYVILGMAAMMGAVLNAPLAALLAVVELTFNPNIIFPAMVVIVTACFITRHLYNCEGIFVAILRANGSPIRAEPDRQILSRVGASSLMNREFVTSRQSVTLEAAKNLLTTRPRWIVIEEPDKDLYLLRAADLSQAIDAKAAETNSSSLKTAEEKQEVVPIDDADVAVESSEATINEDCTEVIEIDLLEIPGERNKMVSLHGRASLLEAKDRLNQTNSEVIYIEYPRNRYSAVQSNSSVAGIITREMIMNYYSS